MNAAGPVTPVMPVIFMLIYCFHKRNHDEPPNDVEEAILLIKKVRTNTMSKLLFAGALRFQDLYIDVFPCVTVKDIEYAGQEIHIPEAIFGLLRPQPSVA